jgi:ferrochelatase
MSKHPPQAGTPRGVDRTAVLLIQLGTPEAPTPAALRRYLRQFLSDPRVIETPTTWAWLRWQLVLHLFILPTRPARSAAKYQRIWDPQTGSPLLHLTRRQTEALQQAMPALPVRFAMQVGSPSVALVVHELIAQGVERLVVLPMYPQYSATTTGSALDALFGAFQRERRIPAVRVVPPFPVHPAYLDAVATIIRDELARLPWTPDYFLLSFHGIPIAYAQRGDPYARQVKQTTAALVRRLGWERGRWTQSFQSLFGRSRWLKPYTDETLRHLAGKGIKRVFIAMPGFTTDCLETLDEIGFEARAIFRRAGGEELHRCPCLNDHPAWIQALQTLLCEEMGNW